jgi:hypothetical protein
MPDFDKVTTTAAVRAANNEKTIHIPSALSPPDYDLRCTCLAAQLAFLRCEGVRCTVDLVIDLGTDGSSRITFHEATWWMAGKARQLAGSLLLRLVKIYFIHI